MKPEQVSQNDNSHMNSAIAPGDAIGPIREVLSQLRAVVASLDADLYSRKPVTTFGGSIGGHVRHSLDHIKALLPGARGDVIDYDHRERGTDVEIDPAAALAEIDRLDASLDSLAEYTPGTEVTVRVMLCGDGSETELHSTFGRELAFVLSHTIHHGAMIGGMVKALGGAVPDGFGLAPSTIAYRNH